MALVVESQVLEDRCVAQTEHQAVLAYRAELSVTQMARQAA